MNQARLSTLFLLLGLNFSPALAQSGAFAVQVAALPSRAEAELIVTGLKAQGLDAYLTMITAPGQGTFYRVRIGRLASLKRAEAYGKRLKDSGLITAFWPAKYDAPLYVPAPARPAVRPVVVATKATAPASPPPAQKAATPPAAQVVVHNPRQNVFKKSASEGAQGQAARTAVQPAPAIAQPNPPVANAAASNVNHTPVATSAPAAEPVAAELDPLTDFAEFTPPSVKGRVESANGQMLLKLRNTSERYRFRGKVRLVIAEGKEESEPEPVPIVLLPNEENTYDLSAAKLKNGSYWVTVYDDQNVLQLIRAASFRKDAGNENLTNTITQQDPGNPLPGGENAAQPPVYQPGEAGPPAPPASIGPPPSPPQEIDATSNNSNSANGQSTAAKVQPGEVKIVARMLAMTTENMTIEFELTAPQPLGYIALSLQTPSINDVKQAIMTTRQGRIPFLAPAADAQGAFRYELKDEQGRVLATGGNTFKQISTPEGN